MLFSLGARAFCQRFDLTNTKQRVKVRSEIFPTMIANRRLSWRHPTIWSKSSTSTNVGLPSKPEMPPMT
jgi:hypothetical protein